MRTGLGGLFGILLVVGTVCHAQTESHKYFLYKAVGEHLQAFADESRIAGMIRVESGWKQGARNRRSGARGLGQFMPSTADWMERAYRLQLGGYSRYSARWSILATTLFMKDLLGDGTGKKSFAPTCIRWSRALAHYSGGSHGYQDRVFAAEHYYLRIGWRGVPVC